MTNEALPGQGDAEGTSTTNTDSNQNNTTAVTPTEGADALQVTGEDKSDAAAEAPADQTSQDANPTEQSATE